MASFAIRSRAPRGDPRALQIVHDPDLILTHLEDAAHFPGGHASVLAIPGSEAAIASVLKSSSRILPIGAQSSLTGGATPMGDVLLSTARLTLIEPDGVDCVRTQAGVSLAALDETLEQLGRVYPPAPTFTGAFVGGIVATNAAGGATFKYGATRRWVQALTVVLPEGDVLDIERGQVRAHPDGYFDLELSSRTARVHVPRYHMPGVVKLSAGYFTEPEMDLVDLFVGSEGTLGVIASVTLHVLSERPASCLAFVPFGKQTDALALAGRLREAAKATWRTKDPHGVDVSGIEFLDRRCLTLLREDGSDYANGVMLPDEAVMALLVTLELPKHIGRDDAFEQIGRAGERDAPDTPLVRFCRMLSEAGIVEDVEIAVPGDRGRAAQLMALREGVPTAVNRRVGHGKQVVDRRIEKTAGDVVVPFERVGDILDFCRAEFARRGLDAAVWGHVSDGNLHPNVLPRAYADVESGKAAMLAIGREAMRLGGAPLAEHGVGRNPIKQRLLLDLYGEAGVNDMRRVKRAIDPDWKLAPGVLFPTA